MPIRVTQDDTDEARSGVLSVGRLAVVLLLFTISNLALISFGWSYEDTGGGPFEKLHPATWLTMALFIATLTQSGNPLTNLTVLVSRHRGVLPFALGILFMILYSITIVGAPFTIFVETFLAPLFLFFIFQNISDEDGKALALLIHALLLCNALLGFYEFATNFHLTPLVVNGEVLDDEWRSTALLGHPLSNAAIVGCYLLMLALGGNRDLPNLLALILFTINFISMFVFGGRAATALVAVVFVLLAVQRLSRILNGDPIRFRTIYLALIAAPLLFLLGAGLATTGFFDNFIERILNDDGSASTRVAMFSIFQHIPISDLLFAPDAKQVGTWARVYGLDYGIENFVISFILTFGILASAIFLPTLVLFCRAVVGALGPKATWIFIFFFAVALTSTSLASKSPLFSIIIVSMMVLMRNPKTAEVGRTMYDNLESRRSDNSRLLKPT